MVAAVASMRGGQTRSPAPETVEAGTTAPEPYVVRYTETPILIDGRLDDPAWEHAVPIRAFRTFPAGEPPISATEARLLWDDAYLYVAFQAQDQDVWGYLTERNASTAREDVLEVFFKTSETESGYYNFEINALGTIYDAYTPRLPSNVAGGTRRWSQWNCEGIKVGIQVHGTLNDYTDIDEGWDMEIAIPFAALHTRQGQTPQPGDLWPFHLARYDYSVYLPEVGREVTTCAPLKGRTFHDDHGSWLRMLFHK